uniref:Uncharacterized protein n=1 Tax=Candidatus Kentrum sp. UNK TaxID=2126344 RepID=A0A451AZP7_9GAMM|nr:MAG: hypothetical protein BECKUNK1418G_GA0071005_103028 [Candidatus Kentron sp. UNK]VFK71387.1 MAG: hypothetical protein BECKUNK1418H_GA0071006_106317 [Candidatus Kentron sp. UNK]
MIHHASRMDMDKAMDTGISLLHNLTHHPTRILEKAFKDAFLRHMLLPHHVGILAPSSSHENLSSAIRKRGFEILSVFPSAVVTAQLTQRFGKRVSVDIYLCRPVATPHVEGLSSPMMKDAPRVGWIRPKAASTNNQRWVRAATHPTARTFMAKDHVGSFPPGHDKATHASPSPTLMPKDSPKIEIFRVGDGLTAADIRMAMSDILHVAYTPRQPLDTAIIFQKMLIEGFEYVGGGVNDKPMPEQNAITVLYFRKRQPVEGIPKIEFFLPGKYTLSSIPGTIDPVEKS